MALDSTRFLVTKDIAIRSGLVNYRYRIVGGRFVLDNKDLSCVRFTTDEYINGLEGVEKVDDETAQRLIAENGYQMGLEPEVEQPQTNENESQESQETETENTDTIYDNNQGDGTETITNEDVGNVEDVLGDLLNNENNENETTEE